MTDQPHIPIPAPDPNDHDEKIYSARNYQEQIKRAQIKWRKSLQREAKKVPDLQAKVQELTESLVVERQHNQQHEVEIGRLMRRVAELQELLCEVYDND